MSEPRAIAADDLPKTFVVTIPAHTRLILASENLLDMWATRTERGERITAEWGDMQPGGWYEPTFTVHFDDVLCSEALSQDSQGEQE